MKVNVKKIVEDINGCKLLSRTKFKDVGMAILKGFPPSHRIDSITHLPIIVERCVKITDVPVEGRFSQIPGKFLNDGTEFMMLPKKHNSIRAVCYKCGKYHTAGSVYGFSDDLEVVWYEEVYEK